MVFGFLLFCSSLNKGSRAAFIIGRMAAGFFLGLHENGRTFSVSFCFVHFGLFLFFGVCVDVFPNLVVFSPCFDVLCHCSHFFDCDWGRAVQICIKNWKSGSVFMPLIVYFTVIYPFRMEGNCALII